MATDEPLLDVAAALADGTDVDWESAAQSITSDDDRRLLAELRFIAGVASHTQLLVVTESRELPPRPAEEPKQPRARKPRKG